MSRLLIIATLAVVCLALAGCAQRTGSPVSESTGQSGPEGAAVLQGDHSLQKSAKAVHPGPREAPKKANRPEMYADGCHLGWRGTRSPACVYGEPSSETTVVLFGDSHAMQWFPALNRLAEERGWRLVGLTKSACPLAEIHRYTTQMGRVYRECDEWRERTIKRIVQEEDPDLIVVSMLNGYRASEEGKRLTGEESKEVVIEGYVSTLEKLRSAGAPVAVIEDVPSTDKDIPKCVSHSLDRLQECAFPRSKAMTQPRISVRAAAEVEGTTLIDATPMICPGKMCPAVIGNVLVYRNGSHLTATYVRTLTPWVGKRLPEPASS